jgi:hypothetical protein
MGRKVPESPSQKTAGKSSLARLAQIIADSREVSAQIGTPLWMTVKPNPFAQRTRNDGGSESSEYGDKLADGVFIYF